jgi:hypothetical protein
VANDSGAQPGWYADPLRRFESRYFNGTSWTADVSTGGDRFVDPLGLELGPVVGPAVGPAAGATTTNSPATAAMVSGIIAVTVAWLPFIVVLGVLAALLALVLGVVGARRAAISGVGRSRAVVGLVTGASALAVAAIGAALTFIVLDVYDDYLDPAANDVTIASCEVVGSRVSASVTLTNRSDDTAGFTVLVGFVRSGTDNAHRTSRVEIDDVDPGERREFDVARQVDLDEVDCIVLDVTGPLPFGLTLD